MLSVFDKTRALGSFIIKAERMPSGGQASMRTLTVNGTFEIPCDVVGDVCGQR